MLYKGIFKELDFPYNEFEKNFEDMWKLMEEYRDFQIALANFVEQLFTIGSKISFLAYGRIRKGIVKRILREGEILYINDKGKESKVQIFYLLQEFYWREMHPISTKRITG